MDPNEDQQMAALVAADRPAATPPDLVALRAGGRRLVRRRRLAAGAAAAAVALAVGVPLAVVGGDESAAPDRGQVATSTAEPTPAPSPTAATTEAPAEREQEVRIPLPGGQSTTGLLETGTILGETVEMAPYEGYERFAYAAGTAESACLSVGLRVDGQVVRLLCAVQVPLDDRFVMWNGYRDDNGEGDGYELLGVFGGDTSVSIGPDGGPSRPVTTRRTDVLPGYTVVLDQAPWDASWDSLQAAPLTVTTGSGDTYTLRRNSYVS